MSFDFQLMVDEMRAVKCPHSRAEDGKYAVDCDNCASGFLEHAYAAGRREGLREALKVHNDDAWRPDFGPLDRLLWKWEQRGYVQEFTRLQAAKELREALAEAPDAKDD